MYDYIFEAIDYGYNLKIIQNHIVYFSKEDNKKYGILFIYDNKYHPHFTLENEYFDDKFILMDLDKSLFDIQYCFQKISMEEGFVAIWKIMLFLETVVSMHQ